MLRNVDDAGDRQGAVKASLAADEYTARVVSASVGSVITALAVTPLEVRAAALLHAHDNRVQTTHQVVKVRQQSANQQPFAVNALGQCSRCSLFSLDNGLIHGELVLKKDRSPHFSWCAEHPTTSKPSQLPSATLRAIRHIYRYEGISGVYSGLGPTLVMAVPATVLYFTSYDKLKVNSM